MLRVQRLKNDDVTVSLDENFAAVLKELPGRLRQVLCSWCQTYGSRITPDELYANKFADPCPMKVRHRTSQSVYESSYQFPHCLTSPGQGSLGIYLQCRT
jgi:hypothetical protein